MLAALRSALPSKGGRSPTETIPRRRRKRLPGSEPGISTCRREPSASAEERPGTFGALHRAVATDRVIHGEAAGKRATRGKRPLSVTASLALSHLQTRPSATEPGRTRNRYAGFVAARENATTHLQEGVVAYRAAQKVWTRDRAPFDWATAHNNLGTCLIALGEREMGTSQLEEAVAVFGEVLEEWTRKRVPLDWATAQTNLGVALAMLGERESESTRLEEAVVAHRLALEERTRERLPLDWATTQAGLGYALRALGERQDGTETLDWAVGAYRAALEEGTRERVPFDWAASFGNQGRTMMLIADRTSDVFLAETALTQIESAYETLRDGGHEVWAASFEAQLPKAQAIRDRLKGK